MRVELFSPNNPAPSRLCSSVIIIITITTTIIIIIIITIITIIIIIIVSLQCVCDESSRNESDPH